MSEKTYSNTSLLTITETAQCLNISREMVYNLIQQGRLGVIQLNTRFKVPYSEIERFIKENTVYVSSDTFINQIFDVDTSTSTSSFNSVELFEKLKENFNNG
ncbi:MAG: helix-turn-helix domain-containing protein [Ignavibacteria bacterium]|nr:helix-turn-helix domain-containing protein [Ignavibacteria bacterium]